MTENVNEDTRYWPEVEYKQLCLEYLGNPKGYEIYRLWYEYLRENESYKEFCSQTDKDSDSPLYEVFDAWANVYTTSWEDTIKNVCQKIKHYILFSEDNPKVWEYSILDTFDIYVESHKKYFKKNPTLKKLRGYFDRKRNLIDWDKETLLIRVEINAPIEKLTRQFKEIVLKKQKSIEMSDRDMEQYIPFPKPSKALNDKDIEYLGRYLQVYHLKENQGLSFEEVADTLDPEGKIHLRKDGKVNPDVWRRERDNAKGIIENVAINIFPGEYGEVARRKKRTTIQKYK